MLHEQGVITVTLEEAIQKAESSRGDVVYIAKDCGDRWAFAFEGDKNCIGSAPVFVYKEDGRCEYFFIGDYIDMLLTAKLLHIPKRKENFD